MSGGHGGDQRDSNRAPAFAGDMSEPRAKLI